MYVSVPTRAGTDDVDAGADAVADAVADAGADADDAVCGYGCARHRDPVLDGQRRTARYLEPVCQCVCAHGRHIHGAGRIHVPASYQVGMARLG